MTRIVVLPNENLCPEGAVIEADPGESVCRALLRNDIDQSSHAGSFVDVTPFAGDAGFTSPAFGVTGLDYDRDGHLDLFVANSRNVENTSTCTLLRNEGGGVFADSCSSFGVVSASATGAGSASWPSVDGEGGAAPLSPASS